MSDKYQPRRNTSQTPSVSMPSIPVNFTPLKRVAPNSYVDSRRTFVEQGNNMKITTTIPKNIKPAVIRV